MVTTPDLVGDADVVADGSVDVEPSLQPVNIISAATKNAAFRISNTPQIDEASPPQRAGNFNGL